MNEAEHIGIARRNTYEVPHKFSTVVDMFFIGKI